VGASIGERRRIESTPNDDRIRALDVSRLHRTDVGNAAAPPGTELDRETRGH
jgi:hypothetical protein